MPPVPLVSVLPVYLYITLGFQIASRIFYKNFCELKRLKSLEFIKKSPFGSVLYQKELLAGFAAGRNLFFRRAVYEYVQPDENILSHYCLAGGSGVL